MSENKKIVEKFAITIVGETVEHSAKEILDALKPLIGKGQHIQVSCEEKKQLETYLGKGVS